MVDHWQKFGPPVYIAVAGYLGLIKSGDKKGSSSSSATSTPASAGDLNSLAQMLSGSGGMIYG